MHGQQPRDKHLLCQHLFHLSAAMLFTILILVHKRIMQPNKFG
jgi:hypothetical protein